MRWLSCKLCSKIQFKAVLLARRKRCFPAASDNSEE